MAKYKVVMTDGRHASYELEREILAKIDAELITCNCSTEDELIAVCKDADGILLDMANMTAKVIKELDKCKVISRYGIGYDNVDVDACTEKGIFVTNVPGYCSDDVSELAIGLMFDCLRQITNRDRLIRQGSWNIQSPYSFRLAGKTIGFIGGGNIARAFMKKMKGFDMELLVYSPSIPQETFDPLGAKKVSLEELLQKSDVVSLHVPAIAKNIGIINKNTLSLMKKSAILINTGRGPLVNDEDLIEALNNGTIAFAGLDTHNHEPLGEKSPFCGLDNVVLTDHCAYNTREAVEALKVGAAENIAKCLVSGRPNTPVNMR